jgi:protein phosphatase/serine/threonine-protein phosphatase Stp1
MRHDVISVSAATHNGTVRARNEDRLLVRSDIGLWAVADGAGGHTGADIAAARIVSDLDGLVPLATNASAALEPEAIVAVVENTHRVLLDAAKARGVDAMASTIVAMILSGTQIVCLWAGDSRAYRYRGGILEQLTEDHSLTQELVKSGDITPQEAERHPQRHVITRAVGAPGIDFALASLRTAAAPGDIYLLCSDGLCKALSDRDIAATLARAQSPADALVNAALANQASDNVTAIVVVLAPAV